jgi:hypothetical protein
MEQAKIAPKLWAWANIYQKVGRAIKGVSELEGRAGEWVIEGARAGWG